MVICALVVTSSAGAGTPSLAASSPAVALVTVVKVRIVGLGSVTSNPAGIDCTSENQPCQANFTTGANITLTATGRTGAPGFLFHVWDPTGPCAGVPTGTCTFRLTNPFYEVIPTFVGYNLFPPTVTGKWKQSVFIGALNVRGFVSQPAELHLNLTAGGRTAASVLVKRDTAGDFTTSVPLPKRFLPGKYQVVVNGQVTGHVMPVQTFDLNVKGPPQGLLAKAFVSSISSVAPKKRLPAGSPGAQAHFVFASLPVKGKKITTTWSLGRQNLGTKTKPRAMNVISTVLLPGGLPNGTYTCVLRVSGKVLGAVSVRIG